MEQRAMALDQSALPGLPLVMAENPTHMDRDPTTPRSSLARSFTLRQDRALVDAFVGAPPPRESPAGRRRALTEPPMRSPAPGEPTNELAEVRFALLRVLSRGPYPLDSRPLLPEGLLRRGSQGGGGDRSHRGERQQRAVEQEPERSGRSPDGSVRLSGAVEEGASTLLLPVADCSTPATRSPRRSVSCSPAAPRSAREGPGRSVRQTVWRPPWAGCPVGHRASRTRR